MTQHVRRFRLRCLLVIAIASPSLLAPLSARADFARPPESPYQADEPNSAARERPPPVKEDELRTSSFRFQVGPALLLQPGGPGFSTALDIGRRAVGARLSGTWLRAESDHGLASYSAEMWIDLRHGQPLHPILGAGASWLRGGALEHRSAGAGVLRGALEYELPLSDADARLGLNVMALVPAIDSERSRPWLVTTLMLGAGF